MEHPGPAACGMPGDPRRAEDRERPDTVAVQSLETETYRSSLATIGRSAEMIGVAAASWFASTTTIMPLSV